MWGAALSIDLELLESVLEKLHAFTLARKLNTRELGRLKPENLLWQEKQKDSSLHYIAPQGYNSEKGNHCRPNVSPPP